MTRRIIVATLTPFRDGALDLEMVEHHTRWLVDQDIDGFAPAGTTGEFLYLSAEEKRRLHAAVLRAAPSSMTLPCIWDTDTNAILELAKHAEDQGAWGVFLPPPLYHPVDEGTILRWYERVREAVSVRVLAYHHPRTHNPIEVETWRRLAQDVGLDGMKDSSGDPDRVRALGAVRSEGLWAGGDHLLGRQDLGPIEGHISRYGNLRPALSARLAHGDTAAGQPVLDELSAIRAAGGIAAMKRLLGMGSRFPITHVVDTALEQLAPAEFGADG